MQDTQPAPSHSNMNFLTKRSSTVVVACLFLLHLSSCHASPVRSPRTSAVKLHDILTNIQGVARYDLPSLIQDYLIPIEKNNGDFADTTNEPFVDQTIQDFGDEEPEMVTVTVFHSYLLGVSGGTEQTALPTDGDEIHSDLLNSGSFETATLSNVQGIMEAEPTQKSEPCSCLKFVAEEKALAHHLVPHVLPTKTTELYHSSTVAAPTDPEELPLTYPLVRVPTAPSATPATVADFSLATILPSKAEITEKVEIISSPEALHHSVISGPEQWISVNALPLHSNPKTQTSSFSMDSQLIQVDQPKCHSNITYDFTAVTDNRNGKESNSSGRLFGSHPKLRELRFPPVSNTKENFGVQINWTEFM